MSTDSGITIERIVGAAAEYGASDVHLTVGNPPILRVDGKLVSLDQEEIVTPDFTEEVKKAVLTEEQQQRLMEQRDITIAYTMPNNTRFKVDAYFQRGALSISFRSIGKKIRTIDELGLPSQLKAFAKLEKGLVLITGPFGSGRTATMAALVQEINKTRAEHIVTIEKPIEYLYMNTKSIIEQREIGVDAVSVEQAIHTAAREDVDVIVVSEMETREEIDAALTAAESSHLVLSTMNTDSVLRTIEKIINAFPQDEHEKVRTELAGTLQGILSQRLLSKVGGGRVAAVEVMIPTDSLRAVIRDGALVQLPNLLQTSREAGSIPMDVALGELVRAGTVLQEDAMMHTSNKSSLRAMQL
ncbi:MAG: PilT/PilU family type 4a pilus ATPase [Patescibacteria group bacterium]|jgi:twitching motility protein PilT